MYLLELALEIFRMIISYAIPQEASDLEAFTSHLLIPRESTKPLQLVNRAFREEVIAQLYTIRPLNIRVYDEGLLNDLIEGREPPLLSLIEYMEAARVRNNKYSLASLRRGASTSLPKDRHPPDPSPSTTQQQPRATIPILPPRRL